MSLHLFRIDAPGLPAHPAALAEGLRRHLAVAPLLSVAVRIGARQQAYLALAGCNGCAHDRCLPGCRAELLRRTLRGAFGAGAQLRLVARGLAPRPYLRAALAWPAPAARLPTLDILQPYDDARLTLGWPAAPKARLRLGALLAVGGAGPDPADALRACGWRVLSLPRRLVPRAHMLLGARLPWAGVWPHDPALLLEAQHGPSAAPLTMRAESEPEQLALRRSTYLQLKAILDGTKPDAPAALGASPPNDYDWPVGPGGGKTLMRPTDLAMFVRAALAAPDVTGGDEPGLSRRRAATLLAEPHKQHAEALLLWFAAAGLLAPPADAGQPYRRPRPLAEHDPARIAQRLAATALPVADTHTS